MTQLTGSASTAHSVAGTITERLADYVVDLDFDDIPVAVIDKAKEQLVYQLGLALSGRRTERGDQAARVARELSGVGGEVSIIGEREKADLLEAVFANSLLMTGMDDGLPGGGAHPGVVVQPVAWAVGEAAGVSGRELLTAVVAGYDVLGKLAKTVWTWGWERPRVPNQVFGPLGAAATAARLFGLSHLETVHALGHASHAGMGLVEGGTFLWPYHALLARNGVMAAVLARAGMPMVASTIEGRHGLFRSYSGELPVRAGTETIALEDSLAELGNDFEIAKARTKRYLASGFNIVPIELMCELVQEHDLTPARVASIEVTLPVKRQQREEVREADLADRAHDPTARAGSLRFQLAVIVTDRQRNPARFDAPLDSALQVLVDKIRLRFETNRPHRYARLEVATTDGVRHAAERDDHVFPPLDRRAWLAEHGRSLLSSQQQSRLLDLISNLENVSDVCEVLECLLPTYGQTSRANSDEEEVLNGGGG